MNHEKREKGYFFQADVARYGLKEAHRRWDQAEARGRVTEHEHELAYRAAFHEGAEREEPKAAAPTITTEQIERMVITILKRILPQMVAPLIEKSTCDLVSQRIAEELPAAVTIALDAELAVRGDL